MHRHPPRVWLGLDHTLPPFLTHIDSIIAYRANSCN